MNRTVQRNIGRFIFFVLLQVLILKRIHIGGPDFSYFYILIYPIPLLMLPVRTPRIALLIIAFVCGLLIDVFYDSPGVHAGALVFTAFLRPFVLKYLEPDTGYATTDVPVASRFGLIWYLQYSGILLLIFLLVYFSLEMFSYVFWTTILLKTIFSFIISLALVIIHQILFNPRV